VLEELLEDPDIDVRVSAANALLRIERRQSTGLHFIDWVIIALYAAAMIAVGFYYARRTKTGDDYLLGGRKTNSVAAGISLMATMVSAIAFLGTTGETIKHGPAFAIFYIMAYPINYFVIGYIIIPIYMKYRFTSAYELLEKPLGRGVRLFASILFISVRFLWMAFLIYLSSKAMVTMLNWDTNLIPVISITMGIITLIYSAMGGFRAVIVTDVSQASLLFFSAVFTVIFVTIKLHGVSVWLPTEWAPNWDKIVMFSFDPHIRLTGFAYILTTTIWWICTLGSDQMAVQRFVSTKDVRAARKAYLSSIIADFFVMISLVLVGMALLKYYVLNPHLIPDGKSFVNDTDFLFPHYIVNYLPVGLTGLVIAGFLSAAMSSLSSGINSSSAVLTSDILPLFRKLKLDKFSEVNRARFMSLIVGVLAVSLSSVMGKIPGNVFEITAKTSNLFVASLFNLFFMAMFVPFATPVGTITGTLYGSTAAILIAFWDMLTGKPGFSFTWILPVSLLVCISTSLIFSLLTIKVKKKSTRVFCYIIFIIPLIVITALLIKMNRG